MQPLVIIFSEIIVPQKKLSRLRGVGRLVGGRGLRQLSVVRYLLKILSFYFVFFAPCYAGQWCEGTINNLWVNSSGDVLAVPSWRGDHIRFCNLKGLDGTTDAVTCSVWYASLSEALKSGRPTTVNYSFDSPVCSQIPTYGSSPIPYYIMIKRQ